MRLLLNLATSIEVDTSDIDPDRIAEAIAELDLFTDENGDELKKFSDLSEEEVISVIHHLLSEDIDSVVDLGTEVGASDFEITVRKK